MRAYRIAVAVAAAVVITACTGGDDSASVEEFAIRPAVTPTKGDASATSQPPDLPARPHLDRVDAGLEPVVGLKDPTALAVRPGTNALYVTEREGRIRMIRDGRARTVLDWRDRTTGGNERGMLGLAFSPDGAHLYVYYIGQEPKDSYLDEFAMKGRRPDPATHRNVLTVEQPPESSVHKGGQVAFGVDGTLYLALGDGGPSDVPPTTSQDLSTLLGKVIRIAPTPDGPQPYTIPDDNPFAGRDDARGEIWALGLRNPWRFSFDRKTGDFWLGDVGRYVTEEINFRPGGKAAGSNYGWPHLEGTSERLGGAPADAIAPLHTYPHDDRCAVIGGYVYRGIALPNLHGAYVYGDFCDGRIRALVRRKGKVVDDRPLGPQVPGMTSFAEGHDGELYVLSLTEGLSRLVP